MTINDATLNALLGEFLAEGWAVPRPALPQDAARKRHLLRTLMNVRPPLPARPQLIELQDRFLSAARASVEVTDPHQLKTISETFGESGDPIRDQLILCRGDITTLSADAIVNAANSKLLGCFIPHHRCIDNVIHSAAGIQLRLECSQLMQEQGTDEPVGTAKLTRGYNLPAKYVLHTVGPMIHGQVSAEDQRLLASCYTACLERAASREDIRTVAFCCISTGEFRFPKWLAARIAVRTVSSWMKRSGPRLERIIFNVFAQDDHDIYGKLLRED
jgi:O-acetyl-ADP-ribose deacetylase (regulator of RNase III)